MSSVYEELAREVAQFQNRVAQGERGLLGWAGGFLFYGEQPEGKRPRLAGYRIARKQFSREDVRTAREDVLRLIPLPILEVSDYLEVLPPYGPNDARRDNGSTLALVLKSRGDSPRFRRCDAPGKTHEELRRDLTNLGVLP